MNKFNFENETMKNNIINFGPKEILEDNIERVEDNIERVEKCKKKVRFNIYFFSVAESKSYKILPIFMLLH